MNTTSPPDLNPFPGLRPFRENEEHLFFGRESQVDAMVDKLGRTHFLAVVGTSGSGKSSLVNCGLRPALFRGLMAAAGTSWRIAQFRPGLNPIRAMASALAEDGVLFSGYADTALPMLEMVEATLRMSRLGVADMFGQAPLPAGTNLLVVADQFEELFRYRRVGMSSARDDQNRSQEATAFVNLLLEAKAQSDCPIYVVLTMRSDFLGDCAQVPGLPEAINDGQYLVPRLTREERKAAIAGPIAVGGAGINPVLLTRLVNDVGDNPDQLSILQHSLNRTWHDWQRSGGGAGELSLQHYEAIGTMAHALDRHAERAYLELADERRQAICEKMFKALTDKGTDARGIRRPTSLGTLCALTEASQADVIGVIEVFRKPSRSFLMPPAPERLEPDTIIDISHESLMRVWERLKAWSNEEAESARLYRRISETAALHAAGKAGLWRDPELRLALDWGDKERPTPAWADQYGGGFEPAMTFLTESETVRQTEVREKEEHQRREVEHEQSMALAKEQQLRTELKLKSARRLGWLAMALGVMFLATLLESFYAVRQSSEARKQAVLAEEQRQEASRQAALAQQQTEEAERQRDLANEARNSLIESLSPVLKESARAAPASAVSQPPSTLRARAYLQIVDERDREYATRVGMKLRDAGFTVIGIEFVPKAARFLKVTEIRYYKKDDKPGADKLVQLLKDDGDESVKPVYLVNEENNLKVRPNHFEVWFPSQADKKG
jgi:hypothetical protein